MHESVYNPAREAILRTSTARPATADDADAIARIYNEGIEDRVATFETRSGRVATRRASAGRAVRLRGPHRIPDDVSAWFDGRHPIIVVTDLAGRVIAWAASFLYRPRECYAGIAECSCYVSRTARGRGASRMALQALIDAARRAGFWKLLSRIFPENHASLALVRSVGFREVGVYERHGRLDGQWRDVVIVEYLIRENL